VSLRPRALNGNDATRSYQVKVKRHTLCYKARRARSSIVFEVNNPGLMKLFESTRQI
jgi:hypothetical protein